MDSDNRTVEYYCQMCRRNVHLPIAADEDRSSRFAYLIEHVRYSIGYKPYRCGYQMCHEGYASESWFNVHHQRQHSGLDKKVILIDDAYIESECDRLTKILFPEAAGTTVIETFEEYIASDRPKELGGLMRSWSTRAYRQSRRNMYSATDDGECETEANPMDEEVSGSRTENAAANGINDAVDYDFETGINRDGHTHEVTKEMGSDDDIRAAIAEIVKNNAERPKEDPVDHLTTTDRNVTIADIEHSADLSGSKTPSETEKGDISNQTDMQMENFVQTQPKMIAVQPERPVRLEPKKHVFAKFPFGMFISRTAQRGSQSPSIVARGGVEETSGRCISGSSSSNTVTMSSSHMVHPLNKTGSGHWRLGSDYGQCQTTTTDRQEHKEAESVPERHIHDSIQSLLQAAVGSGLGRSSMPKKNEEFCVCNECHLRLKKCSRSKHVLVHLRKGGEWRYQCLLCTHRTIFDDTIKIHHLPLVHGIKKPQVGIHFNDYYKEFGFPEKINAMNKQCFG